MFYYRCGRYRSGWLSDANHKTAKNKTKPQKKQKKKFAGGHFAVCYQHAPYIGNKKNN